MRKFYIMILLLTLFFTFTNAAYGAADIYTQGELFFSDAQSFILKVSIPAATIGIGCGVLMKKFSFGDPQKIKTGGTIIWASIIGWAVLNGAPLIFATIQKYI